jgi:hypothetical protein
MAMSETQKITLEYRRQGELSTGTIDTEAFEGLPFDRMLYRLAQKIIDVGDCEVVLRRTDRRGYHPYRLDAATVELLRRDPVAAVQALTFAGSPSSIFQRVQKERRPIVPSLRVGLDVLADAFGEQVHVKLRAEQVECPGCGFWSPLVGNPFTCRKRCLISLTVEPRSRWAAVFVKDLLGSGLDRFYLPREWNPGGWVTRESLEQRLTDYVQEREDAKCLMDL